MKRILYMSMLILLCICGCSKNESYGDLQDKLSSFCKDKDAKIGIAVIIDGKDTVAVNDDERFPMLSVYKFPIALALGEYYRRNNLTVEYPIAIFPEDLHPDIYSPMTEDILKSSRISTDTLKLPTSQLLAYMLQMSDNNASDIALREAGGARQVNLYLNGIGTDNMNVASSEAEMYRDNSLCYANYSTPKALAELLDHFDSDFNDSMSVCIKQLMETCSTGQDRLAKPLVDKDIVIGHKTGTGFILPDGRIMAINDAGYVHLPDGRRYVIAVFVENSGYNMAGTEALIADISKIVCDAVNR